MVAITVGLYLVLFLGLFLTQPYTSIGNLVWWSAVDAGFLLMFTGVALTLVVVAGCGLAALFWKDWGNGPPTEYLTLQETRRQNALIEEQNRLLAQWPYRGDSNIVSTLSFSSK
jgi:hypothetical protein